MSSGGYWKNMSYRIPELAKYFISKLENIRRLTKVCEVTLQHNEGMRTNIPYITIKNIDNENEVQFESK